MKSFDLDSDIVDLISVLLAVGLVVFAQFKPETSDRLYEFATLAAGSGLRGLGTHKKNDYFEDGDRQ